MVFLDKMSLRKIKLFIKFHWIAIVVIFLAIIVAISFAIFLRNAIIAWQDSEYYFKKTLLAQYAFFFYVLLVIQLISFPLTGLLWFWIQSGGANRSMTRLHKKAVKGDEIQVRWKDVIGMKEVKIEAKEIVNLITDRRALHRVGGKIIRGLILLGPPGCGKTYLAKAIATECGLPFLSAAGSEFVEMFVGVGASRIRKLFKQARHLAHLEGGCVIFIDEIDALGARRSLDAGFGGRAEHNQTLNQLLVEMDGLKDSESNIVVVGATNVKENVLDSALLRPGRFDRKIYITLPSLEERDEIFGYYLSSVQYDKEQVKTMRLARMTAGHSPADISNMVREAALIATRKQRATIKLDDLTEALERIELGLRHPAKYDDKEKRWVAYHEAGHAIILYLCAPHREVSKASIIRRKETGGVIWGSAMGEFLPRREDILGNIKVSLGSYAAEKITFGYTSSGVDSDFEHALSYAHYMVWRWGMGPSGYLGNLHFLASKQVGDKDLISEETKKILDDDTQKILRTCLEETENILSKDQELLDYFANELMKKEELNYDEIEEIFKKFGKTRSSA